MSIKIELLEFDKNEQCGLPLKNLVLGKSLIQELLLDDLTSDNVGPVIGSGLENPFIDWDPRKVRDLAVIEDFMVNQYMITQKSKYQKSSRIVKGTLNDPVFTSAENLKQFLDDGIVRKYETFKFNCEICDYGSNFKYNYGKHLDSHQKLDCNKIHQATNCDICGKYFANLGQHIRDVHEKLTEKCDICGKVVMARSMDKHKEVHNKVECKACGEYFTETILRLRHPKHCAKMRKNPHQIVKREIIPDTQLVNSVKCSTSNTSSVKCDIYGKYFDKLNQHMLAVTATLTETCGICGKVVAKHGMIKHRETHNKVECKECGHYFTDSDLRLRHLKNCKKSKKLNNVENPKYSVKISNCRGSGTCDICGKYFNKLRDHTRDVHEKPPEKCDICGRIVMTRSMFKHKETHNKVECKDCGLYFTETILRLRHSKQCRYKQNGNVILI